MKLLRVIIWSLFAATTQVRSAPTVSPNTDLTTLEQEIIVAAKPAAALRFNGARVIGIRPGLPLVYSLAVSGERPVVFSTKNLPVGLDLHTDTGIITGTLMKAGEYKFNVTAKNSRGKAETEIKLICGNQLALTPPLGWNSYDAFGDSVTEDEILANAAWMQEHLQPLGWDTVVVDFRWYDPQPTGDDSLLNKTRVGAALTADEFGRLLPAPNRFPSATNDLGFKPLADKIHALGLKFGIHVMRGVPRQAVLAGTKILGGQFTAAEAGDQNDKCPWCPDMFGARANAAAQAWYDSCAQLWAAWGVDYIKVDDLSMPYHTAEIEMIHLAIAKVSHAIVFSTSPGPTATNHAAHIAANANLWRISGDFWDRWQKLDEQFDLLAQWQGIGAPGHWPDADMIPLGHIAIRSKLGGNPHWTHFTRDEQRTLMSLWSLAPSPLMLGMNLPDNDDWTTALLTNPEVIAVNQDALGQPAQRLTNVLVGVEIWTKPLADKSLAVGLFNRGKTTVPVKLVWHELGLRTQPVVYDLWLRKNLPKSDKFSAEIPPHSCWLLRVK